jgi:hypothetical protein
VEHEHGNREASGRSRGHRGPLLSWGPMSVLALLGGLLTAVGGPAGAQSFGPPVKSAVILEFFDSKGNTRFTLATFYAQWKNPFRTTIKTVSPALGFVPVSRQVTLAGDPRASALFEGTYTASKRWRIGFWYNPVRGERLKALVQVVDVPVNVDLERDTDLMDLHAVYYGPNGLSAQLGYYQERGTLHDRSPEQVPSVKYRRSSPNLWVTKAWELRAGDRLVTPSVSLGYHSSSDLDRAVSLMTGAGVSFNERFSASGSIWLFDFPRNRTRVTAGVEYRF